MREAHQRLAHLGPNSPMRFEPQAELARLEDELADFLVDQRKAEEEKAALKKQREEELEAHRQQEADALEADLRRRFRQAAPGGSEQDYQFLKPKLLEQRVDEARATQQRQVASYSFIPDGAVIVPDDA